MMPPVHESVNARRYGVSDLASVDSPESVGAGGGHRDRGRALSSGDEPHRRLVRRGALSAIEKNAQALEAEKSRWAQYIHAANAVLE